MDCFCSSLPKFVLKPLIRNTLPFLPFLSKLSILLIALHSIPASDPLTIEFALDVWCDPQFSALPKSIHLTGEVFGELRWVDHQQGFIVGVCCWRRPIEWSRDHGLVIDHSELVMELVTSGEAGSPDAQCLQWSWRISTGTIRSLLTP